MTRYLEIKPGSLSEVAIRLRDDYQAFFKKELEKTGKSIASMTDAEKKSFFNRVDKAYNAKNEATSQHVSPSLSNKPVVTNNTTLVAAPGGKEKVIRIPKEKLADYKAKGYVEAEEFVPEETVVEEPKNAYAIGMAAAMKATGDKPPLKKSTIVKAHDIAKKIEKQEDVDADEMNKKQKEKTGQMEPVKFAKYQEANEETINEAGMKEIDTTNQEIKRLRVRLTQLRDAENAAAGGDTTNIEKQIHQTRRSLLDLQKKALDTKQNTKLKEGKMNYKSYKKSLKNEETPKNLKKTMTGQPVTKIDTEPKMNVHN